jgi:ABC-2 type transport system permease protein
MRKLLVLALKEVRLAFRDVGALVTMLATPLGLTLAIGLAFGGGGASLSDVPVLLLNQDDGVFAEDVVSVLESDDVASLLDVERVTDEAVARQRVESDEVAALIVIPADFSAQAFPLVERIQNQMGLDLTDLDAESMDSLSPEQQRTLTQLYLQTQREERDPAVVEIYASADWQISTSAVKGVLSQALEQLNMTVQGINIIASRLIQMSTAAGGSMGGAALFGDGGPASATTTEFSTGDLPVQLEVRSPTGRGFNWLDYSATSMAVLFLMFAVTSGGRTLLAEREGGTLPRLLVSPTPALTILVGKMAGIVLTGLLQVSLLWGATSLWGAYWGPPLGVAPAIVALVLCATGVGALISAWARTPGQASAIGTAVTLVASALSGTFFPRMGLPEWVQTLSLVTPNAWGIELFTALQSGEGWSTLLPLLGGTLALTVAYYLAALFGFRRQFD